MPLASTAWRGRRAAAALACAAALAGAVAGAAGCGGGEDRRGTGPDATTPGRDGGGPPAGARTGAAGLRGTLAGLLAAHAGLSAFTLNAALADGLDDEAATAGLVAVDGVARRLAGAVGQAAGRAAGERFLELWRAQNGAAVDYAKARAAQDATSEAAAEQRLDALRDELGELLEEEAVARRLRPLTRDVLDAVDAAANGSGRFYDEVRRAGARAPALSEALAVALVRTAERRPDGSPTAPAADLRARLTALLAGHVHLTVGAVAAGAGAGLESPAYRSAAAVLDHGSRSLAGAFGEIYGRASQRRFLELWRAHVGMFITYATAQLAGDRAGARAALEELEGWRRTFGAFVAEVVPALPAGALTQELEPYVETVASAIRAAVKRSPRTFDRLRAASARTEAIGALLADGIARHLPERFPSG